MIYACDGTSLADWKVNEVFYSGRRYGYRWDILLGVAAPFLGGSDTVIALIDAHAFIEASPSLKKYCFVIYS